MNNKIQDTQKDDISNETLLIDDNVKVLTKESSNTENVEKKNGLTEGIPTESNNNEQSQDIKNEETSDKIKLNSNKLNPNVDLNAFIENLSKEFGTSVQYIRFLKSLTEQDQTLPLNNVANIMKSVLPDGTKISKDAKQLMQECCSELISFITSEATEIVSMDKRKTVMGDDIITSLDSLGFENYGEIMRIYLQKYKEFQLLKQLAISLIEEENPDAKALKKQKKNSKQ